MELQFSIYLCGVSGSLSEMDPALDRLLDSLGCCGANTLSCMSELSSLWGCRAASAEALSEEWGIIFEGRLSGRLAELEGTETEPEGIAAPEPSAGSLWF